MEQRQSAFPLVRLVIPEVDHERRTYSIQNRKMIDLYINILGISKTSQSAQRLRNWRNPDVLKKMKVSNFQTIAGDFPKVVESVLLTQAKRGDSDMTIGDINNQLDALCKASLKEERESVVMWMVKNLSPKEQKWMIRVILKDMKIGIKHMRVLNFLGGQNAINHFTSCSNLRKVVENIHDRTAGKAGIQIGTPFYPMLAKRFNNFSVTKTMKGERFGIEPKMDGERMLIHKNGSKIKYWTRNRIDYTEKYGPSFNAIILKNVKLKRCILDGEIIAWDNEVKAYVPFGHNRTVAKEAQNKNSTRWLCYLAFDILHDGKNALTERTLSERRKILESAITNDEHHMEVIEMHVVEMGTIALSLSLSYSLPHVTHACRYKNSETSKNNENICSNAQFGARRCDFETIGHELHHG